MLCALCSCSPEMQGGPGDHAESNSFASDAAGLYTVKAYDSPSPSVSNFAKAFRSKESSDSTKVPIIAAANTESPNHINGSPANANQNQTPA